MSDHKQFLFSFFQRNLLFDCWSMRKIKIFLKRIFIFFSTSTFSIIWFSCCYLTITSYIHNTANHAIAKNSCQSYLKKFEVLFSRRQQGVIRADWKILSCILYHLCIVVTIFQVTSSFSIFSTTRPSLAQYRKQYFYIYLC